MGGFRDEHTAGSGSGRHGFYRSVQKSFVPHAHMSAAGVTLSAAGVMGVG